MNFKKLAGFVFILGLLICFYGGVIYIINQPEKFDQSKSKMTTWGGRDDFSNYFDVQESNMYREAKRNDAIKFIVAGGIVVFIAIGINVSTKNNKKSDANKPGFK